VWLLGWASFFTDVASEAIYPLLPAFLSRVLGAGAVALGLVEGLAEAANSLLKIAAGHLSDRWQVRKPIVIVGYGLSGAVRPFMALVATWPQVLGLRFVDRLGKGLRGAPRDAMLAALAGPDARGRVFGFNRAMDHAGAVAGPLLAAAFLFWYPDGLRTLFALTVVPGVIVILLLWRVPEVAGPGAESSDAVQRRGRAVHVPVPGGAGRPPAADAPRLPPAFFRLLGVIMLFTLGNSTDAFLLLRLADVGVPVAGLPLLWAGLHVVKSAGSILGGTWSDRAGRRTSIVLGWLLYAAVYTGFALATERGVLVGLFLAYGVYYGLSESPEKALVADLTPPELRGTAFGFYNAALGLGSLLASVAFGAVWSIFGAPVAFTTGAALALAASGALLVAVPDPKARPAVS
jgi:MFS family permease